MIHPSCQSLQETPSKRSSFRKLFTLPGGKVEKGETLRTAAVREFQEEAGVSLDPAALRPRFRMTSPEARSNLYLFETILDASPADIRLGEGAGFAFVAPDDFTRLDLAEITKMVLDAWRKGSG